MIQELSGVRKISVPGAVEVSRFPSPTANSSTSEDQNLKCPRCESSNTKFCYYNNYNLTQPRYFCKTCRRYWTKGGALRNIPFGGGCRRNRNTRVTSIGIGKLRTVSSEFGKSSPVSGFPYVFQTNPVLWASPQSSHLLSLLRTSQNPNPNPISSSVNHELYAQNLGLWGSNQHQAQQQSSSILGEFQNTEFIELYQRTKASTAGCFPDNMPVLVDNIPSSSSSYCATILESAPVAGGELGCWNMINVEYD